MRNLTVLAAAVASAALAAGCGAARPVHMADAGRRPSAAPTVTLAISPAPAPPAVPASPTAAASPTVPAPRYTGPHFDTPQAAMTYLAAAYNRDDITTLHHLTEPRAFTRLMAMRAEAVNLRLKYCTPNPGGDYNCYFAHDFPASEHKPGHGHAMFIAAPARNPGWYMFQFQSCD
jgi:predicted lipid-binding transport protein (Tim44 family)